MKALALLGRKRRGDLQALDGYGLTEPEVLRAVDHAEPTLTHDRLDAVFAAQGTAYPGEGIRERGRCHRGRMVAETGAGAEVASGICLRTAVEEGG
jgi:hypothetical protein